MEGFGDAVSSALEMMRMEKRTYKDYLPQEALDIGAHMAEVVTGIWEDVLDTIVDLCLKELPYEYPHPAVWWYSVIIDIKKDASIFLEFVQYVRAHRKVFSKNTQYFLFYQLIGKQFSYAALYNSKINVELWDFFLEIVDDFVSECTVSLEQIPEDERNEKQVLVIVDQFLGYNHAPTITALDRCAALQKMGKEVLLINTAEVYSVVGKIPFLKSPRGSYICHKSSEKTQYWKGMEIPYYQCSHDMPDIETMDMLLAEIRRMAPKRVVIIGGQSVFGSLVDRIIPAVTVGCIFSELSITQSRYQTLTHKPTKEEEEKLRIVGYDTSHIIESVFTFDLKPQMEQVTRKELSLPEDAFIMAVVGNRLDKEVSDEFLQLLDNIFVSSRMYIIFLGKFKSYEERIDKFPTLKDRSTYLGYCTDVLSRMEVCDLYINPLRKGGGSSCLEAMYKGKPVVTIGIGDVSVNSGEDFWVKDYKEMGEKILQYYQDKEFYKVMSEKALKRSEILLDTDGEFAKIMEEYDRRETERNRRVQDAGV